MTTEQHMLSRLSIPSRAAAIFTTLFFSFFLVAASGCASTDDLGFPQTLVAPYNTRQGDTVWAVGPMRNESGVSALDPLQISDILAATLQQTRGISVAPLNRTLGAMRALGLKQIASPADARQLAAQMGVDAIVVGTITAWDPYNPPQLGLSLALYGRSGSDQLALNQHQGLDPRMLESEVTNSRLPKGQNDSEPLSIVSKHFDGANDEVLFALRAYAQGRHDANSPLGWRSYLASMSLFTKFACFRLTGELLDRERLRLARLHATTQASTR